MQVGHHRTVVAGGPDVRALLHMRRAHERRRLPDVETPRVRVRKQRRAVDEEAGEPVAEDVLESVAQRGGHRLDLVGKWHAADAKGALSLD